MNACIENAMKFDREICESKPFYSRRSDSMSVRRSVINDDSSLCLIKLFDELETINAVCTAKGSEAEQVWESPSD